MAEQPSDLVSQHPLYLAMCKCIGDELEMYDYHDFYPGWGVVTVNYRDLIQELFKVEKREVASFIKDARDQYQYHKFMIEYIGGCPQRATKLFRFILSLPMCEYEIENWGRLSSSDNKGSSNNYSKQFPFFEYDCNYLTEMDNDEVVNTILEIINRTENEALTRAFTRFAFHEYILISRERPLEDPYRRAFLGYLIQPICSMLSVALHIETKVETERQLRGMDRRLMECTYRREPT